MIVKRIIVGILIGAAIGAVLEIVNIFFAFFMPPFFVFLPLSMLLGGCIGALLKVVADTRATRTPQDFEYLPACGAEFISRIGKRMRYRHKVREEVQAELAAHFEDDLKDCLTEEQREQRAERLIADFGEMETLAVLMRRAKKRCRPLWRTVLARTFQAACVLIVCLVFYVIWFSTGKPTISVDYVALFNRMNQPEVRDDDNAWPHYERAFSLYVPQSPATEKFLLHRRDGKEREAALRIKILSSEHRQEVDQWLARNRKHWDNFSPEQQAVVLRCFECDWVPFPEMAHQGYDDWRGSPFGRMKGWRVTPFDRMAEHVLACIKDGAELKRPRPRGPLPSSAGPGFPAGELKSWLKNRQVPENFLEAVSVAVLCEADRRYADLPEDLWGPPSRVECEYLLPWINQNESAWEELLTGSRKSYCYRPYLSDPNDKENSEWSVLPPPLIPVKYLARLGIWRSRIDRGQGRVQQSAESCLAVARVGAHWQGKGTIIEQLVGLSMCGMAHNETLRLLETGRPTAAELASLQGRLSQVYAEGFPAMNMEGERLFIMDAIQRSFTDGGPGGGHLIPGRWSGNAYAPWLDDGKYGLLPTRTAASMVHAGRDATVAKAKQLCDQLSKLAKTTPYRRRASHLKMPYEMLFSLPKHKFFLIRELLPPSDRLLEIAYRGKMHYESTLTILALGRWRLEKNRYPETLSELATAGFIEELPMDPYSDKPLIYRRVDDDFILYSVGLNFKDDDGQVAIERGRPMRWGGSEAGDIVFWPTANHR